MKVEYARKALSDLRDIAGYYNRCDNPSAAAKIAVRIQQVIARLTVAPESGRPVADRHGVRVVPLLQYRYNLFYFHAAGEDRLRILHIRHSSRRGWGGLG